MSGSNLDLLCVWQSDAALALIYFDAKHLEKGFNGEWETFWFIVLTLLPHWCKISSLHLVLVPNY